MLYIRRFVTPVSAMDPVRFPKPYTGRLANVYLFDLTMILSAVTADAYTVCNGASPTGT
jgi:hypothetical protein